MNELIKTSNNENGEIIISGRELHGFLGSKERFSKWFEKMCSYGFDVNIDYTPYQMVHPQNKQEFTDYAMKLDMAKEISMLQRSERGKQARHYFLKLEKLWNSPEMVMKRALEFSNRQIQEMKTQLLIQEPLVSFAETCMASEKSLLVREVAKICCKKGIMVGEKKLWQKLRDWKLVFADKNEPYQEYLNRGYFEVSQGVKETSKGTLTWLTMRVTPKGQAYIMNRLKKEVAA
ncbi:antA/AntB antirepressor family protein [Bacillus massiliigorillae]|uniref:antA/AntB antirepressor family protein n=1 Tax=Bacillus massiliigorillae TaxID=1243664 RepID=UPI0003AA9414|nr:antA/AntB antirepressor family protein [Bacillus massiliigorillae]